MSASDDSSAKEAGTTKRWFIEKIVLALAVAMITASTTILGSYLVYKSKLIEEQNKTDDAKRTAKVQEQELKLKEEELKLKDKEVNFANERASDAQRFTATKLLAECATIDCRRVAAKFLAVVGGDGLRAVAAEEAARAEHPAPPSGTAIVSATGNSPPVESLLSDDVVGVTVKLTSQDLPVLCQPGPSRYANKILGWNSRDRVAADRYWNGSFEANCLNEEPLYSAAYVYRDKNNIVRFRWETFPDGTNHEVTYRFISCHCKATSEAAMRYLPRRQKL